MKALSWLALPLLPALAWVFLKIGLVFFGGGFVAIPLTHRELVQNLHWLTEAQFVDGLAISQLTPGPVAVLATFAGYVVAGVPGALVATAAIFLPGSVLMIFLSRSYELLRKRDLARQILNTLIPVIAGLLVAASLQIARTTVAGWVDVAVLLVSLVALTKFKVNPAFLVIGGALLALARSRI
ncbi:MAG: chromate transporter [Armatimonadia bacterium]